MVALLVLVIVACALLVIYPYVIYPVILLRFPKVPLGPQTDKGKLTYALMFCAYNEEKALPETIGNLRKIKAIWPELEILAYSDNSSDRTFQLLDEARDVLTAVEGKERAGKPRGMRTLVSMTNADIAIFMDANVLIDASTIRKFEDYFASPEVGTVAGTLHYINDDESAVAGVGGLYWRLEEKLKRLESLRGSTLGADGSLFAMRRRLYPEVRPDLQDDFLASMEAIFHGMRCISAPDILAFERGAVSAASEFRRKRRIACGAFSTHRYLWSRITKLSPMLVFCYVSHKVIRWFGAFFLALGFLATLLLAAQLGVLMWFGLLVALGVLALLVSLRLQISPVIKLMSIVGAMVATGIGIVESLLGGQYAIWNPVER